MRYQFLLCLSFILLLSAGISQSDQHIYLYNNPEGQNIPLMDAISSSDLKIHNPNRGDNNYQQQVSDGIDRIHPHTGGKNREKVTQEETTHTLSRPNFVKPTQQPLQGIVTVQWTAAVDSLDHTVYYNLSFISEGTERKSIKSKMVETTLEWDTNVVEDNNHTLILTAYDKTGDLTNSTTLPVEVINHKTTSDISNTNNNSSTNITTSTNDRGAIDPPVNEMIIIIILIVLTAMIAGGIYLYAKSSR